MSLQQYHMIRASSYFYSIACELGAMEISMKSEISSERSIGEIQILSD